MNRLRELAGDAIVEQLRMWLVALYYGVLQRLDSLTRIGPMNSIGRGRLGGTTRPYGRQGL